MIAVQKQANVATVATAAKAKPVITFVGKAWVNTVNKEGSKVNGKSFINVSIDRQYKELTLQEGDRMQLWPNTKREGKNDADYRMSIISA